MNIEQVKERYEAELMAIDGVVSVGIGECEGKSLSPKSLPYAL